MTAPIESPLVAADVGNTHVELGLFVELAAKGLPRPVRSLRLRAGEWDAQEIRGWLGEDARGPCMWRVASVRRQAARRLTDWLSQERPRDAVARLVAADLPLVVAVDAPEKVGIDRLLAAVAANRLRDPQRAAIVVDLGSAITVDLISVDGAFAGGAILPGIAMGAGALHERTDQLPPVTVGELHELPAALGTSTSDAIRSGLYWGAVGAVRELIDRLSADLAQPPQLVLTGGDAPLVARQFEPEAQLVPLLVHSGIAITHAADCR